MIIEKLSLTDFNVIEKSIERAERPKNETVQLNTRQARLLLNLAKQAEDLIDENKQIWKDYKDLQNDLDRERRSYRLGIY